MTAVTAREMPDLRDRLAALRSAWAAHLRAVVVKAPKERPDLLVGVLILAVFVVALYIFTTLQHV